MLFRRLPASWQMAAILTLAGGVAFAAPKPPIFTSYNAVSDILGVAHETDPALVNPWGIAIGQIDGDLRVADDGTGVATIYKPDGGLVTGTTPLIIPAVTGNGPGSPTGVAENYSAFVIKTDTNDFDITSGTSTAPAHYLFATEDGGIVGYRSIVSSSTGILAVSSAGAGYTGVALSYVATGIGHDIKLHHQLYATDFAEGKIDVYDSQFGVVTLASGAFAPPASLAAPPAGLSWSPFNIKSVDFNGKDPVTHKPGVQRRLVVAYALHSATSNVLNDVPGAGYGYVDSFYPDGTRVAAGPVIPPYHDLNSPWAIAVSHHPYAGFPALGVLLVGNHGDGTIHAYAFQPGIVGDGFSLGSLVKDTNGTKLAFDGLWALHFGAAAISVADFSINFAVLDEDVKNLYFSAGLLGETHGLVGDIYHP